jgi:hypothetical protein
MRLPVPPPGGDGGDFGDGEGSGGAGAGAMIHRILVAIWTRPGSCRSAPSSASSGGAAFGLLQPVNFTSRGQMVWLGGSESLDVESFSSDPATRRGLVETAPYLFQTPEVYRRVLDHLTPEEILADEAFNDTYEPDGEGVLGFLRRQARAVRRDARGPVQSRRPCPHALQWMLGNTEVSSPRRSNIIQLAVHRPRPAGRTRNAQRDHGGGRPLPPRGVRRRAGDRADRTARERGRRAADRGAPSARRPARRAEGRRSRGRDHRDARGPALRATQPRQRPRRPGSRARRDRARRGDPEDGPEVRAAARRGDRAPREPAPRERARTISSV